MAWALVALRCTVGENTFFFEELIQSYLVIKNKFYMKNKGEKTFNFQMQHMALGLFPFNFRQMPQ